MTGPQQKSSIVSQVTDEVAPENSPLLHFLVNNSRRIAIALALLVAAGAGYGVYSWQQNKALTTAQEELGSIMVIASDADRLAKLKAFAAKAPAGMKDGVQLALARTALLAKDYPSAVAAWDSLTRDTKSAVYATAVVGKAESLVLDGKDAEALSVLTGAKIPDGGAAANLVNSLVVDLAEKTGDYATAIAASEKLVTGSAAAGPEEADFWRQKAASLRLAQAAAGKKP